MRTLKFRAWNKKRKKMYKVLHLHLCSMNGIWATVEGFDIIEQKEIHIQIQPDNIDIMQFTGLTDKNGKDIYEGDILDCQDRIVKVVWHKEAGQWDTEFIRYVFDLCSNGITNQEWKYRSVIIGNIHENPELL